MVVSTWKSAFIRVAFNHAIALLKLCREQAGSETLQSGPANIIIVRLTPKLCKSKTLDGLNGTLLNLQR